MISLRFPTLLPALLVLAVVVALYNAGHFAGVRLDGGPLWALIVWAPFILKGFLFNIVMSLVGMTFATVLGGLVGLALIAKRAYIRLPARLVMQTFRSSPWIVILFVIMMAMPYNFSLPGLGEIRLPDWLKATFALSLPVAANLGEVMRGAIASVPKGQWEGARSLALPDRRVLMLVILPQCFRRMIPPWMNWFALLALSTPMAAILGVGEGLSHTQAAMESAGSSDARLVLPFYGFLLVVFFVLIFPISLMSRRLERKLSQGI